MKRFIVILAAVALIGAFWTTAAIAEGWRVGDFADTAFLDDMEKATGKSERVEKVVRTEKSGEKTLSSPETLSEEARGYNG